jgi:hypothetical protein
MIRRWFLQHTQTGGNEMPRTSTRIRRLGEPVLVLMDTDDDWQPGTVIRCIAADRDADWLYVIQLESGERVRATANRIGYRMPSKDVDPTPEEIRQRCLEIQSTWTDRERLDRMGTNGSPVVEVQEVHRCRASYLGGAGL